MKRSGMIIGGIVIMLLMVAGLFGWQTMSANAAAANSHLQTATVQRGTLVATVSSAGNVTAPQEAALTFQTTGRVVQVNVQVGDTVKKDQVLMTLDTTDLDLALKGAQANLASAQASFDAAKAKSGTNPDQLIAAKAAVDKAAAAVQQAQAAYDRIGGASNPSIGMTAQSATLQQATSDYNAALANYKVTAAGINDTALRTAQAQLDSAQVAVDQAKSNLEKTKILAPFDGVVSVVNYHAGDTAGSSGAASNSAVTVVNLSNLEIQVNVAEVDMPKIKVGETAQLTLDALPGNNYAAKVVKVDPVGIVTQGVVNYPITVAITNPDGSIEPGMTANLNIVVAQQNDVLMIPTRAVHTQGNQKTVTVLYKGETLSVPITTGLSSDQNVEVTSGLQQGDLVVLSQTQTQGNAGRGIGGGAFFLGR